MGLWGLSCGWSQEYLSIRLWRLLNVNVTIISFNDSCLTFRKEKKNIWSTIWPNPRIIPWKTASHPDVSDLTNSTCHFYSDYIFVCALFAPEFRQYRWFQSRPFHLLNVRAQFASASLSAATLYWLAMETKLIFDIFPNMFAFMSIERTVWHCPTCWNCSRDLHEWLIMDYCGESALHPLGWMELWSSLIDSHINIWLIHYAPIEAYFQSN